MARWSASLLTRVVVCRTPLSGTEAIYAFRDRPIRPHSDPSGDETSRAAGANFAPVVDRSTWPYEARVVEPRCGIAQEARVRSAASSLHPVAHWEGMSDTDCEQRIPQPIEPAGTTHWQT